MRSNSRLRGAAMAAALLIPSGVLPASADGFRGGPGGGPPPPPVSRPVIGVGAYAPGEGPVGASGWYGGNWHGPQSPVGVWGGGYYGGGYRRGYWGGGGYGWRGRGWHGGGWHGRGWHGGRGRW